MSINLRFFYIFLKPKFVYRTPKLVRQQYNVLLSEAQFRTASEVYDRNAMKVRTEIYMNKKNNEKNNEKRDEKRKGHSTKSNRSSCIE